MAVRFICQFYICVQQFNYFDIVFMKNLTAFFFEGNPPDPVQVFLDPYVDSGSIVARTSNAATNYSQKNWEKILKYISSCDCH